MGYGEKESISKGKMIVLIMGLPGSGKTTLAEVLVPRLNAMHLNGDAVRKELNDYISNYTSLNFADLKFNFSDNLYEAFVDADAIIILTEWEDYKELDWLYIKKVMRSPSWIFDTRGIVDKKMVKDSGINLWKIGDGTIIKD